jgi:uncharacterized damage-inducible protein DinB
MPRHDIVPIPDTDLQIGLQLAMLDQATEDWLRQLGPVSDEVVRWQPFPGAHSVGGILLHLADCESAWIHEVGAGIPRTAEEIASYLSDETDQYSVDWPVPPAEPLAWYVAKLRAVRKRTHELVQALNDPEHMGYRRADEFTLRWILSHIVNHEAYHGGQAVFLSILHGKTVAPTL